MAGFSDKPQDLWLDRRGNRTKLWGTTRRYRVTVPPYPTEHFSDGEKGKAQARKRELLRMLEEGEKPTPKKRQREKFGPYATAFIAKRQYSPSGRRGIERIVRLYLNPFFGEAWIDDIKTTDIVAWDAGMRVKVGKGTKRVLSEEYVRQCGSILGMILAGAVTDGLRDSHPFNGWAGKPKAKTRAVEGVWEQEVVHGLLGAVPDREHAIPLLGVMAGLRQGESLGLAKENTSILQGELKVLHKLTFEGGAPVLSPPKNDGVRVVPIGPTTSQCLAAHMQRYPSTLTLPCTCHPGKRWTLLFVDEKGQPHDAGNWNEQVWHPALHQVGIKPNGPDTGLHQLRHFYASHLIASGLDAKTVSLRLGHKSPITTMQIYVHLFNGAKRRDAEVMEALLNSMGEVARVHPVFTDAEAAALHTAAAETLAGPWAQRPEAAALQRANQKLDSAIRRAAMAS